MTRSKTTFYTIFLTILLSFSQTAFAFPIGPFAMERTKNVLPANNGFAVWEDYFIEYSDSVLKIQAAVQLSPTGDVTLDEINGLIFGWEQGIEDTWNDKFFILKDNTHHISIEIDVIFNETIAFEGNNVYNHEVNVRRGPKTSNEHLWDTEDTGLVAAHEFGHMLGLFDEYAGGATDPGGEILDATSIMGSSAPGSVPYKRHYEDFRSWLAAKDTTQSFELFEIPEPETILLFVIGLILLAMTRLKEIKGFTG